MSDISPVARPASRCSMEALRAAVFDRSMVIDDWFLTAAECGNPFTRLDHRHGGRACTSGNHARVWIDGVDCFARLLEVVSAQRAGDLLLFTDWRGDADERLAPDGPMVGELICAAARRGVLVRGLFWRSHVDFLRYSERQNREFADEVRRAGGEAILDQRGPPMGCHHQEFIIARHPGRPELDVAFVGGIDLCHTPGAVGTGLPREARAAPSGLGCPARR